MRFDFSSQFLRVIPPDTNFGDAWESLCDHLLREEAGTEHEIIRLGAPDRGIDILDRHSFRAYQCKSSEQGAFGTIKPKTSIQSFATAVEHREHLEWDTYCFATNANYSGMGLEKVKKAIGELGLPPDKVQFLGPEYWDRLCVKHEATVLNRFDFRLTAGLDRVVEAFRKARYFDKYVADYQEKIRQAQFFLVISNNRTPLEIEIPFSPELTVENFLDVSKEILGISLEWINFTDLQTSTGPSVSVTVNRRAQPFKTKIKDLPIESGDKLEIWLKIVWKDETQGQAADAEDTVALVRHLEYMRSTPRGSLSRSERGRLTIERGEAILQSMLWTAAQRLERPS